MSFQTKIITELSELLSLRQDWTRAWNASSSSRLHYSYEWFLAGMESYHADDRPHVLAVYDQNRTCIGIAPLVVARGVYRGVNVRKLCFPLNEQSPSNDLILSRGFEDACLDQIADHILQFSDWDIADLRKLPEDGRTMVSLQKALSRNGVRWGIRENIDSPYIVVQGDWETFWQSRSQKLRKVMRNKLNRAGKNGKVQVEALTIQNADHPVLKEIRQISGKSWKRNIGADLLHDERTWKFYETICGLLGPAGFIKVWLCRNEGQSVAFEFHLEYDGVAYPIRADYDEAYREMSPGSILEYSILKQAFTNSSLREYNSCGHTYTYLMRWTDRTRSYRNIEIFGRGAAMSSLHTFEYHVLPFLRRLKLDRVASALKQPREAAG